MQTDITVPSLWEMKQRGEKIAVLTSYDATFTQLLEAAGVEVLLVGDSLGMVIQGQETTLPVTVRDMVYHTRNLARVRRHSLLISDMPFMSYSSVDQALATAGRLMRAGAHMVKLEGGGIHLDKVARMVTNGIPVCAHLGLLPQSVHKLGGYKVQGRDRLVADQIRKDAQALAQAGASLLVLECVPAPLAAEITGSLQIPVIGIGAGAECDGQVLVLYDMLGIGSHRPPRFVRNFLAGRDSVQAALADYVKAVKEGGFPGPEEMYGE